MVDNDLFFEYEQAGRVIRPTRMTRATLTPSTGWEGSVQDEGETDEPP